MDIPRPASVARNRGMRRILYGALLVIALVAVTLGLSRLEPAAPEVDRATVWIDTVERGPMLRQVRGSGTLVPEEIRWIPAVTQGRVERIRTLPGTQVTPDTVLLELSNPELQVSALDARSELEASEAAFTNLRIQLESQRLTQEATAAAVEAEHTQAKLQAEADAALAKEGLLAELTLKLSQVRAKDLEQRAALEGRRLAIAAEAIAAQLAAQQAQVDRLRGTYRLRMSQVEALAVKAGTAGVLQQVPVEVGQQVTPGTNLARVAEPGRLKAEVRIAETQARDVTIGQTASIDTRNGVIPGVVTRVDPAVENGTVTVDVALKGELPRGARPDLTVDGTIELERMENVLHMGRPAFGQEEGTIGIFRLTEDGHAVRARVTLGKSSVTTIEIRDGLQEGDQVILSDMSQWDAYDRVRLN
jgi:HlyD family secretion protein